MLKVLLLLSLSLAIFLPSWSWANTTEEAVSLCDENLAPTIHDSTLTADQKRALINYNKLFKKDQVFVLSRGTGDNQQTLVIISEKNLYSKTTAIAAKEAMYEFDKVQLQAKPLNYQTSEEKVFDADKSFGEYTPRDLGQMLKSVGGLVPIFKNVFISLLRLKDKPITKEIRIREDRDNLSFTPTYIEKDYRLSAEEVAANIGKSAQTFFIAVGSWFVVTGIIPDIIYGGVPYLGDLSAIGNGIPDPADLTAAPFAYLAGTTIVAKLLDSLRFEGNNFYKGVRALLRNHKSEKDPLYIYRNENILSSIEDALEHIPQDIESGQTSIEVQSETTDPNLLVVVNSKHVRLVVDRLKREQGFSALSLPTN